MSNGRLVVCAATMLVALSCAPHPVEYRGTSEAPERIKQRSTVVTPWSHVVDTETLQSAEIHPDRIVFEGEASKRAAKQYEKLDILASEDRDHPFLRRVTGVEERGDRVVMKTRPAALTEAVFKGEYSPGRSSSGDQTRGQSLAGGYRDLPFQIDANVGPVQLLSDSGGTFQGSVEPKLSLEPEMLLDVDVAPRTLQHPDDWVYDGARSCRRDADCHEGEFCNADGVCSFRAEGGDWSTAVDPNPWDDDQHTCSQMVRLLELMEKAPDCRRRWEQYWANEGAGSRSEAACRASVSSGTVAVEPPYRAQVEWAKRSCSGRLQSFEFDLRMKFDASLEDISLKIDGSGTAGGVAHAHDPGALPTIGGSIGPVPVWVTPAFDFNLAFGARSAGTKGRLELEEPLGLEQPVSLGAGVHYYASRQERNEGNFGSQGESVGTWHPNQVVTGSDVQLKPKFRWTFDASKVGFTLRPTTELKFLFYNVAGPHIDMRFPDTKATGRTAPKTNGQGCGFGGQTGLTIEAGVKAQAPELPGTNPWAGDELFSVEYEKEVFNSCSTGYCSGDPFCAKQCFTGDCGSGSGSSNSESNNNQSSDESSSEEICYDGEDNDGDGDVDCADDDCPDEESSCDGHDNDCDGSVDEGLRTTCYADNDGDGYGSSVDGEYCKSCKNVDDAARDKGDCDDSESSIHPGRIEVKNSEDDNCNGTVDESTSTTCYSDNDGDGHGAGAARKFAASCQKIGGVVANTGDCNDSNGAVYPGATEICTSSRDYDCDGAPRCDDPDCAGKRCDGRSCSICTVGRCQCP